MASADRDSLEALFRSTGGGNWKRKPNWATDDKLSTWGGVTVNVDGQVTELMLRYNNLEGPIPGALAGLAALVTLDLWRNQLTGPIPEALGALTNLTELNLQLNQLEGPIPEALGALTNLKLLNLGVNKLSGHIPGVLGGLINLKKLNLDDNQLAGPIPKVLGALTNLTDLSLDRNQLAGPIPEALGALTNLTWLSLGENELAGPIPEALGALTKLGYLNLKNNQLSGTLPLGVWKLSHTTMDLSDNLLTHFIDPREKSASSRVVLDCMERQEMHKMLGGLRGNPWQFPPAAVMANGRESIRRFYNTWEQCDFRLEEIHALKVVFVGAYGAGKTSLVRSIQLGRGDRTPEVDENKRTTVGVDLHSHKLRNGTECKIYDVAGQITYYGLHQFFLTERAVYAIVLDATKFEGRCGKDLDEAVKDNVLEWVSLLHMRTPLCTVMLVASHFDMLGGATDQENEQLLVTIEERFLALHEEWKSLRDYPSVDRRMTILPGVFPVGCKLESESASCMAEDGLRAVEEALSKQTEVVSLVPPSWVAARQVLEQVGGACGDSSGEAAGVDGRRRPWELRSVIHAAFSRCVEEGRRSVSQGERKHPASELSRLDQNGIRDSMDGAIELRAFSGTVISHDVFVVLDVMWLAGVLKPILDHRGVAEDKKGRPVFAERVLGTSNLLRWATELVGSGILRHGFACFLWSLKEKVRVTEGVDDPHEMDPAKFEEILERIGVTIPLPLDEDASSHAPAAEITNSPEDHVDGGFRADGRDLLVIMRLPLEADAATRENLSLARKAALNPTGNSTDSGKNSLKVVFEFDYAGAPHGLPERVMALSHKIGVFSSRARWRLGGLFLLHDDGVSGSASSMILEYDKPSRMFVIEALGQGTVHVRAVQFVISALYHVALDFSGASWTAWMGCKMDHAGEKMYLLAMANEKQNQTPGSKIVPLTRNSRWDDGSEQRKEKEQRNLCGMQGLDARGSCSVDPNDFGRVLDIKQPFQISDEDEARLGGLESRSIKPNSPTTSQRLTELAQTMGRVEGGVNRVEGGVSRVEGGVGRVEEGIRRIDRGMQAMATGIQESLARLKNLQAPNYRYPHLVEVKEVQAEGARGVRSRVRGMFMVDMTLHFLCSFDMSKVPCGVGGNGYRLRKPRGWVKKISPALQVTIVTARVALKAVAGVEVPGLSGFLQAVQEGLVGELVDRALDEDVLLRVLSGDHDAGAGMQRDTRDSYDAIKEFMAKEEADRRRKAKDGDGYVDFRENMAEVDDGEGGLVWVRTENVQKWRESLAAAAPST